MEMKRFCCISLVKKPVRTVLNKFQEVLEIFQVENAWTTDILAPWLDNNTCLIIQLLDPIPGKANTIKDFIELEDALLM
jgi:hypothetical protein